MTLRRRYREMMDQVTLSEEEKQRILEQALSSVKEEKEEKKPVGKTAYFKKGLAVAAAFAVLVTGGVTVKMTGLLTEPADEGAREKSRTEAQSVDTGQREARKAVVGDYVRAASYDEIYAAVRKESLWKSLDYFSREKTVDKATTEGAVKNTDTTGVAGANSHSDTNVVTEGVYEGDFVKTDGSYTYQCMEDCLYIYDIRGSKPKEIVKKKIAPREIHTLYLDEERGQLLVVWGKEKNGGRDGVTYVTSYDVTDPGNPKETGVYQQPGYYEDARIKDGIFYLFTNRYLAVEAFWKKEKRQQVIPEINGKRIACDRFYVRPEAGTEYVVSSFALDHPEDSIDQMVIMNHGVSVYMGENALYLYEEEYDKEGEKTKITKFTYRDGYLNGVGMAKVTGVILDTFAINEQDGYLRVLSTSWEEKSRNRLTVFDEKMEQTGGIEGFAKGEEIYAARCLGNLIYCVTYHNTDPLFVIDVSDPENPVMKGELKVTGFADYLHPFGENRLLGIGLETDPATGENRGVKLTMYDVADPLKPEVIGVKVLKDLYASDAQYDYKSVFADVKRGLFGFTGSSNRTEEKQVLLFRWEEDRHAFVCKKQKLLTYYGYENTRILRQGERFFVAHRYYDSMGMRSEIPLVEPFES